MNELNSGSYSVTGPTHTYFDEGTYSIRVTITDDQNHLDVFSSVNVADAPVTLQGASAVLAFEGAPLSAPQLATGRDLNFAAAPSDLSATVNWGDGSAAQTATIRVTNGTTFSVVGPSHAYSEEGSHAITVGVADVGGSTATATTPVTVSDSQLSSQGTSLTAKAKKLPGSPWLLASFTDADPAHTLGDYSATVNRGDGSATEAATVASVNGTFTVSASHMYGKRGSFVATIATQDIGGATTTATTTITAQ